MQEQKPKTPFDAEAKPYFRALAIALCVLLAWYALAYFAGGWELGFPSQAALGQFGDYLGGILNPIVATCALIAIWKSIAVQREELMETRNEMRDARRVMIAQQLDTTFFEMMRMLRDAISNCSFGDKVGEEAIQQLATDCRTKLINTPKVTDQAGQSVTTYAVFKGFYANNERHVGHLFRSIVQLLKLIDSRVTEQATRDLYLDVLRANCSDGLFFICDAYAIFGESGERMSVPAVKLGLFDGMFEPSKFVSDELSELFKARLSRPGRLATYSSDTAPPPQTRHS